MSDIEEHSPSTDWLERMSLEGRTAVVRDDGARVFLVEVREL